MYPVALSKDVRSSTDLAAEWRQAVLENPYITLFSWFESLNAENKQAVIGAEESGEILLFDGPQQTAGVDVIRDADAKRL